MTRRSSLAQASQWPTFFIPGFPKCGTTTLSEHLARHPDVTIAEPKEPSLFRRTPDPVSAARCFAHGADARHRGDATTHYVGDPQAIERIAAIVPQAHFVICLRDPVARFLSHYEFRVQQGREERPIAEVVRSGDREPLVRFSLYDDSVAPLFERFERSQLHFVLLEDLEMHPERVMTGVHAFLGIADRDVERVTANRAPGRSSDLPRRLLRLAKVVPLSGTVSPSWKKRARHLLTALNDAEVAPVQPTPVDVIDAVRTLVGPDVRRLERRLAVELASRWPLTFPEHAHRDTGHGAQPA